MTTHVNTPMLTAVLILLGILIVIILYQNYKLRQKITQKCHALYIYMIYIQMKQAANEEELKSIKTKFQAYLDMIDSISEMKNSINYAKDYIGDTTETCKHLKWILLHMNYHLNHLDDLDS